jgi:predicted N-acetyltransferase YhbS
VYITNDMHNHDLVAQEDTIFVVKEHRNGVGKKLVQFGLDELKRRGVKRLLVSAMTDLRVAKLWGRMGFKEVATQMMYTF